MKSLQEYQKDPHPIGTIIKQILTYDWIFSKWWEKLILAASVLWGGYSLIRAII